MSISLVFRNNLRILSGLRGNVSAVARDIDINRVQYNRFLNGESFPKPAVLKSLCEYFGVDARIYVEPLSKEQIAKAMSHVSGGPLTQTAEEIPLDMNIGGLDCNVPQSQLPDGLHLIWRLAFSNNTDAVVLMLQVKTVGNVRTCKGYEVAPTFQSNTAIYGRNGREFSGIVTRASDGFSLMYSKRSPSFFLGTCFFEGTQNHGDDLFYGFATLHRGEKPGMRRVSRAVFQLLPPTMAGVLPYARKKGVLPLDVVPKRIAALLQRDIR